MFQLDFLRRVGQGRAAELFGSGPNGSTLQSDELSRVLNIPAIAHARYQEMSATTRKLFEACAAGINLFIKAGNLPLEFQELGYTPDAWQPEDSLAVSIGVAMNLDTDIYLTKIQYSAIAAIVGSDVAATLAPPPPALSMFDATGHLNPPSQFVTGSSSGGGHPRPTRVVTTPRLNRGWQPPQRQTTGLGQGTSGPESNNYAVDGRLTSSGHPLVANDPHLPLTTPTLAYEAQLEVDANAGNPRINIQGLTFPGFPIFVSARTETTSWAVTFLLLDDVDVYAENVRNAANGGQEVLVNGTWVPVTTRNETINVAGESPVTITVSTTPHGPILNAAFPTLDAFGPVALKTTPAQSGWTLESLINLPRTSTWSQFQTSVRTCSIGFNFLFSDETGSYGHIGYQAAGLVPIRQSLDNAFVVVPGDDGAHEWTGFATPDELPSVYDPPAHVLATGNNRIVPDNYNPKGRPIYISNYSDAPWRAQRVYTRLLNARAFGPNDFAAVQLDTLSVVNQPLRDTLVSAITRAGLPAQDPSAQTALNTLKQWDGKADASSKGAAIFETLLFVLLRDTALGAIGPELYAGYASSVFITQQELGLRDLLDNPRAPFFGATGSSDAAGARDHAVSTALGEADALLRTALGNDVSKWTWGGVHTLTYDHPLATVDSRFDLGSFPANGDPATPLIGGFFTQVGLLALPSDQLAAAGGLQAALAQDALQVARVVWEPSSKTRSLGTLSTGESGDPRTSHYGDQAKAWRAGQYLNLPFSH